MTLTADAICNSFIMQLSVGPVSSERGVRGYSHHTDGSLYKAMAFSLERGSDPGHRP
jgi:hypothetical protein